MEHKTIRLAVAGTLALVTAVVAFSQAAGATKPVRLDPLAFGVFRDPVRPLTTIKRREGNQSVVGTLADLDAAASAARKSMRRMGLNPNALFLLALADAQQRRPASADRLAALGNRLSRRHSAMQMFLFERALQARRLNDVVGHLDTALRAEPALAGQAFPIMAQILAVDDFRALLADRLRQGVPWSDDFIAYASAQPYARRAAGKLVLDLPDLASNPETLAAAEGLTLGLAADGETTLLRKVYLRLPSDLTGIAKDRKGSELGRFDWFAGIPPIAWAAAEDANYGSAITLEDSGEGLAINAWANSGHGGDAATRLMWLSPGSWRIESVVRSDNAGRDSDAQILVQCAAGRPVRTLYRSRNLMQQQGKTVLRFVVPATCDAVWLRVNLRGNSEGTTAQLELSNIKLSLESSAMGDKPTAAGRLAPAVSPES